MLEQAIAGLRTCVAACVEHELLRNRAVRDQCEDLGDGVASNVVVVVVLVALPDVERMNSVDLKKISQENISWALHHAPPSALPSAASIACLARAASCMESIMTKRRGSRLSLLTDLPGAAKL